MKERELKVTKWLSNNICLSKYKLSLNNKIFFFVRRKFYLNNKNNCLVKDSDSGRFLSKLKLLYLFKLNKNLHLKRRQMASLKLTKNLKNRKKVNKLKGSRFGKLNFLKKKNNLGKVRKSVNVNQKVDFFYKTKTKSNKVFCSSVGLSFLFYYWCSSYNFNVKSYFSKKKFKYQFSLFRKIKNSNLLSYHSFYLRRFNREKNFSYGLYKLDSFFLTYTQGVYYIYFNTSVAQKLHFLVGSLFYKLRSEQGVVRDFFYLMRQLLIDRLERLVKKFLHFPVKIF